MGRNGGWERRKEWGATTLLKITFYTEKLDAITNAQDMHQIQCVCIFLKCSLINMC